MSVDGTDCAINEPVPFIKMWFSNKFQGPALRYEAGVSNGTGRILWDNGPFPAGRFPDLKIFMKDILRKFPAGEAFIAKNGYAHVRCITPITVSDEMKDLHGGLSAPHENVNARLKNFNIIGQRFCHNVSLHGTLYLMQL